MTDILFWLLAIPAVGVLWFVLLIVVLLFVSFCYDRTRLR